MKHDRRNKKPSRKGKNRSYKNCIYIYCQGEKTEYGYFESLRNKIYKQRKEQKKFSSKKNDEESELDIRVETKRLSPEKLSEKIKRTMARNEYDDALEVWYVFDKDDTLNQEFNNIAGDEPTGFMRSIYSNPCFELWIYLHFINCEASWDSKTMIEKTKNLYCKRIGKQYNKNDKDLYKNLEPYQSEAISRAKVIADSYPLGFKSLAKKNPSTTLHKLVCRLNKLM
jgi:hypothetical protein